MTDTDEIVLEIAFRQRELGRGTSIEDALALEYRMTKRVMEGHDFFEGIRALLVDKDNKSRWQHRSIAVVGKAKVARHFESLGERELRFA